MSTLTLAGCVFDLWSGRTKHFKHEPIASLLVTQYPGLEFPVNPQRSAIVAVHRFLRGWRVKFAVEKICILWDVIVTGSFNFEKN